MDLSKIQKLCTQNLWQLWFRKIPQFWRKNVLFKKFCTHLQEIGSLLEIWANFWRKILKLKNTKKKFSDRVAFFEQAIKVASTTKRRSSIDKSSVTSKCNFSCHIRYNFRTFISIYFGTFKFHKKLSKWWLKAWNLKCWYFAPFWCFFIRFFELKTIFENIYGDCSLEDVKRKFNSNLSRCWYLKVKM